MTQKDETPRTFDREHLERIRRSMDQHPITNFEANKLLNTVAALTSEVEGLYEAIASVSADFTTLREGMRKLSVRWKKTATEHADAGASYQADPYYKCAAELESLARQSVQEGR